MKKSILGKIFSIGKVVTNIAGVADIVDSVGDIADSAQDLDVAGSMPEETEELNDFQKTIRDAEIAEVETKEKLSNFLNNAYGYDVSKHLDL